MSSVGLFISSKIICCLCRSSKRRWVASTLSALPAGVVLAAAASSFVFSFSFFSLLTLSFSFSCFVFAFSFSACPPKGERSQSAEKTNHHPSLVPDLPTSHPQTGL